jgi:hypothetical protein
VTVVAQHLGRESVLPDANGGDQQSLGLTLVEVRPLLRPQFGGSLYCRLNIFAVKLLLTQEVQVSIRPSRLRKSGSIA